MARPKKSPPPSEANQVNLADNQATLDQEKTTPATEIQLLTAALRETRVRIEHMAVMSGYRLPPWAVPLGVKPDKK